MFVNSINHFRAIAVLFIVFGHCYAIANFKADTFSDKVFFNLVHGGTTFFVFISGFLFYHIFFRNFAFKKFLIKKTKYVLVPYLFLSTIPLFYLLIKFCLTGQFDQFFSFPIIRHFLTGVGESFLGYWYIPFIMVIFLVSMVFIWFIKQKLIVQIIISILLFICSIFMHRGTYTDYTSIFQNVLYYTPIYMFGILFSKHKDVIYANLKGTEYPILAIIIVLAILQVLMGKLGFYRKNPFIYDGIDLMIIQKTFLCFFFVIWLNRFESHKFRFLDIIAVNSFGIFFTHGILLWGLKQIKDQYNFAFNSNSFLIYFLVSSLVLILSLAFTLFVKKILPVHSRFVVGS